MVAYPKPADALIAFFTQGSVVDSNLHRTHAIPKMLEPQGRMLRIFLPKQIVLQCQGSDFFR